LGIGDWAQSPIPNPQSPIPNPQSPFNSIKYFLFYDKKIIKIFNNYLSNYNKRHIIKKTIRKK
jgi:hypothetical protein